MMVHQLTEEEPNSRLQFCKFMGEYLMQNPYVNCIVLVTNQLIFQMARCLDYT